MRTMFCCNTCNARSGLLLLALAVTGGCNGREGAGTGPPSRGEAAVPVEVAEVEAVTFEETVRGVGTLETAARVDIRPEVDGVVQEILFREGRTVKEGDLLFVLDDSKLQLALQERKEAFDAAEATLQAARRAFDRQDELFEQNATSKAAWDEAWERRKTAEEEVQRLEAAVALAKERIDDTKLVAPLEAVASECPVEVGDYVARGERLLTLYPQSSLEVAFWVPGRHLERLERGQTAEVRVDAYPDRPFSAKVTFLSPRIHEQTRQLQLKAVVDDPEGLLKPGAFATVRLTVNVRKDRPAVPESSLVATREGYVLFVVEGDVARQRSVQIGVREPGRVEIIEGVEVGETVVRAGYEQLADGDRVDTDDQSEADQSEADQPEADEPQGSEAAQQDASRERQAR